MLQPQKHGGYSDYETILTDDSPAVAGTKRKILMRALKRMMIPDPLWRTNWKTIHRPTMNSWREAKSHYRSRYATNGAQTALTKCSKPSSQSKRRARPRKCTVETSEALVVAALGYTQRPLLRLAAVRQRPLHVNLRWRSGHRAGRARLSETAGSPATHRPI
jgi:hypothetical protein